MDGPDTFRRDGYKQEVTTYADLIMEYLYQLGVGRVFGIPGGAIEPLFNALARHKRRYPDGIKLVVARHESGAAHMAAGYARETGNLGVCCSTAGPGATNLVTGVASAYLERVPLLVITPQTALRYLGRMPLQDSSDTGVDMVGLYKHTTCYNSLVSHRDQLERKLVEAVSTAFQSPQGPAHLSIPMDILARQYAGSCTSYSATDFPSCKVTVDEGDYYRLYDQITRANKIVLLVGGECGCAADEIIRFAELTRAAMVTTPKGKAWIDSYHSLNNGVVGFAGHDKAYQALFDSEVDLRIVVGVRVDELSTLFWKNVASINFDLVYIDSTLENLHQLPLVRSHVYGDLKKIFKSLLSDLLDTNISKMPSKNKPARKFSRGKMNTNSLPRYINYKDSMQSLARAAGTEPVKPCLLMYHLGSLLTEDTRVVVDSGSASGWAIHYLHLHGNGNFRVGLAFGAMGWAIGHAIGAACALDNNASVVVITDGASMLTGGQELTVAVAEQLPVLFIVLNELAYGTAKHSKRMGDAEPIGFQLPQVDFAITARAMGVDGRAVRNYKELKQIDFNEILRDGPSLLDVYIDREEIPPMSEIAAGLDSYKAYQPSISLQLERDEEAGVN